MYCIKLKMTDISIEKIGDLRKAIKWINSLEGVDILKNKKCVAFLDVLGFSSYINSNANLAQESAMNMLNTINFIFKNRVSDHLSHPWQKYESSLQNHAKRKDIDSFDCFMPMSDGIFIIGNDANTFIDQVSSFLCNCFTYAAKTYLNPIDHNAPERIIEKRFTLDENKGLIFDEVEVQCFPSIFRGGVCFDNAVILQMTSLMRNEKNMSERERKIARDYGLKTGFKETVNVAGKGIVSAVGLERCGGKGPKLFISNNFFDQLDCTHKNLIALDDYSQVRHFMWPAYSLIWENNIEIEILNGCNDFLLPAIRLWNAYKGQKYEPHYCEFVKLIINSYLSLSVQHGVVLKIKEIIRNFLEKHEINCFSSILE